MRALVCGGRDFNERDRVYRALDGARKRLGLNHVIQGGARGADLLAKQWAETRGIPCDEYRAEWGRHGRAAGPLRNQTMIEVGKPDIVIAFPGTVGTADMIARAEKAAIPVERG